MLKVKKMLTSFDISDAISFFVGWKCQKKHKIDENS